MTSKSKTKGNSFEREVAKFLSDLYSESFIRNLQGSGSYIGGKNVVRKDTLHEQQIMAAKGDIVPPGEWKYFNCEAKNYADFPFSAAFAGKVAQLEKWLEQLMTVADEKDFNVLVFKITRKGRFVAIEDKHSLSTGNNLTYNSGKYGRWTIMDFDAFWNHKDIREIVKNMCVNGVK